MKSFFMQVTPKKLRSIYTEYELKLFKSFCKRKKKNSLL